MNKRAIICISREHGSGGRIIGEELAEMLGIPFYDKKLIEQTAREHGVAEEVIQRADEKPLNWADMGFPMGIRNPYKDTDAMFYMISDQIYNMQATTIRSIAAAGSCIIVGRVAAEILKDDPDLLSVFILAQLEDRIRRIMSRAGVDRAQAAQMIKTTDKNRARYHNNYSDKKWGACDSYHLAISTSHFGIDGAVRMIRNALE